MPTIPHSILDLGRLTFTQNNGATVGSMSCGVYEYQRELMKIDQNIVVQTQNFNPLQCFQSLLLAMQPDTQHIITPSRRLIKTQAQRD